MQDFVPSFGRLREARAQYCAQAEWRHDPAEAVLEGRPDADAPDGGIYGACSAESYRAAGALYAAHRDAGGFLDAVDGFATPDFWRRVLAVKSWIYDRADGAHGAGRDMDAVRVFYHAGHGRMEPDGTFHLPMGALWSGADASLSSERMRFGEGALRYLFWSASESMRVAGGHDPMRSWFRANRGLRMMFGFASSCWDSGRQGMNFWRHWRMGKPLAQAWLDGAWDVSHDQGAVACACGDSPEAARARLWDERRFHADSVSAEHWAWRWLAPSGIEPRAPGPAEPPAEFAALRLVPAAGDRALAEAVLSRLGFDPALMPGDPAHGLSLRQGGMRFLHRPDGHILLDFGLDPAPQAAPLPLVRRLLVGRARTVLRRHGFLQPGTELVFDRVALALSATASRHGAHPPRERLDEIIVQFRQAIDGIPVLTPDAGTLRLAMRADGAPLRIESSLRRIAGRLPARACRRGRPDDPPPPEGALAPQATGALPVPQILARRSARLMRDLAARGAAPLSLRILPGSTEIGYGIRSDSARLVARQGIEIECLRGFRKRYWIQSDLGD